MNTEDTRVTVGGKVVDLLDLPLEKLLKAINALQEAKRARRRVMHSSGMSYTVSSVWGTFPRTVMPRAFINAWRYYYKRGAIQYDVHAKLWRERR